ncbi:MAG: molybdate ABC transporter permease subunit [Bdellovibrionaceae bacterium]|nr:molybdate ABC transporter permease subunit [Bdellovibrionales bacterium]MCB9082831.1 molybdate ABC transporter permease subunit [Pseudobdellovibrionaceae bacterium]
MLSGEDILALGVTLRLAGLTTLLLLVVCTPLAWWMARSENRIKPIVESVIALPLILPPTVLGFYLLVLLGPEGLIGWVMTSLGLHPLAFTFAGLVIGSFFYSLPFVVQPLQDAFIAVGKQPLELAATLGANPWDRFFRVALPLARPGFLTATVLGFAHTVGEFGVVLMIGGNIPGKTQVLSIAIFDHVEAMDYTRAHLLSAGMLILSFALLLIVYGLNRRHKVVKS